MMSNLDEDKAHNQFFRVLEHALVTNCALPARGLGEMV